MGASVTGATQLRGGGRMGSGKVGRVWVFARREVQFWCT